MKKTDGFTLLELIVGILCATLITSAAMSLLLMGARTNRSLVDTNSEQQTARILTSMVESLASEGGIKTVEVQGNLIHGEGEDHGDRDWALLGDTGTILSYSFDNQTIYSSGNTPIMEGVISSTLTLSKKTLNGCLLGFSIQTEHNYYETSAYCRSSEIDTDGIVLDKLNVSAEISGEDHEGKETTETIAPSPDSGDGRFAFLEALCTQYGSTGNIVGTNTPFSEWYLLHQYDKGYDEYPGDWSENTPWCACFLSWGVYHALPYLDDVPCFASVVNWKKYFTKIGTWTDSTPLTAPSLTPTAGDLIFFDWVGNDYDGLEHIGVVFYVDSQYVYTIEGNNSNRVELSRYERTSADIKGYGILDWKTNDELNS